MYRKLLFQSNIHTSKYSLKSNIRSFSQQKNEFMNPQTDFTFKKLLDNHELLIPVLNDAFNLIEDNAIKRIIDFTDPERLRNHATDKSTTYDLSCITEKGERIIVEMQRASQQHFYKRAIYNLAVDVTCQSKIGNWDWKFDPVYQLCVCSFKLFPKVKLHYAQLINNINKG